MATWRGRPIHAFYTSTCGGHTEEGTAVFEDGAPYLRGVACPTEQALADEDQPGGQWEVRLRPGRGGARRGPLRQRRPGAGPGADPGRGLGPRRGAARVGSEGQLDLRGQRVRLGLGLRESLFVLHRETDAEGAVERFVITGKGWGHGVGLCQVGASGMARAGRPTRRS